MTLRTEAEYILDKIAQPDEKLLDALQDIVDRDSDVSIDGSIDEAAWFALRDFVDAQRRCRECRKHFQRLS